jgi:hypothetical protein
MIGLSSDAWLVLLGALIGAVGSVAGGWFGARAQIRLGARINRSIRWEERRERALEEILRLLVPVARALGSLRVSHEMTPDADVDQEEFSVLDQAMENLDHRWDEGLGASVGDVTVFYRVSLAWMSISLHTPADPVDEIWTGIHELRAAVERLTRYCTRVLRAGVPTEPWRRRLTRWLRKKWVIQEERRTSKRDR